MGKDSKISWTNHTFNPWIGCTKVTPGCKNCYAEALMDKRYGQVKWGPEGKRVRTSEKYWKQPRKWDKEALAQGVRRKVFCASLADVFEDKQDQPELSLWRHKLYDLILETPNLDWLLLTKRPENIMDMIPWSWASGLPGNIWIGVSASDQPTLIDNYLYVARVPAHIRFLSLEPLIAPIDLGMYDLPSMIDWVIVGGESGPNARPMQVDWVRNLKNQCINFEIPFFFKQWGRYLPEGQVAVNKINSVMINPTRHVERLGVYNIGKKIAGSRLDGEKFEEFPA